MNTNLRRRAFAASTIALCLSGCATPALRRAALPSDLARLGDAVADVDFILLGEVHDNPSHHEIRLEWLRSLSRRLRFALALEQLDADRQSDIDRSRARWANARALAEAAGFEFGGWNWRHYEPFMSLALAQNLPLYGANLSNAGARGIARGEVPVQALSPADWSAAEQSLLEEAIRTGHCGVLPERAVRAMATAQRARDATIAATLIRARRESGLPVVLIAGNGHVRRDIGVPRHLTAAWPQARWLAVGFLESGSPAEDTPAAQADQMRYDRVVVTAPHLRPDPCEAFRRRPAGQASG